MWYLIRMVEGNLPFFFDETHVYPGNTWDILAGPCTRREDLVRIHAHNRILWGRLYKHVSGVIGVGG